jgi:hypothetical protein
MAYPYDALVPVGTAGLTLTASVVDTTGAAIGSQPASNIRDLGGGLYLYTTSAMPDGHRGAVLLKNGTLVVGGAVVTPRESENNDIKISTAQMLAAQLVISPLQAVVTNPRYQTKNLPPIARGSQPTDIWVLTDSNGTPLNLTGKLIRFVGYTAVDPDKDVPYDEVLTPAFEYESSGGGITVTGASSNQVNVTHDSAKTANAGDFRYWLWNTTDKLPLAKGKCPIEPAVMDYP